jgi:hypothetical protein
MAIAAAARSRATESDGGQARMAKGEQLTRANGDGGVDGVNSVVDPEPERTAWLVLVPWRLVWLRDSATATTTDLAASAYPGRLARRAPMELSKPRNTKTALRGRRGQLGDVVRPPDVVICGELRR